ncbi:MAG: DUF4278 domain-containing protein [Leptolyngbya sp. SIO3F4]|nr:DUF4278 domain-containing protein [Leptolyngbya sp. SIO3F4]
MQFTHLGASYTPPSQDLEIIKTPAKPSFLGRLFSMRAPVARPLAPERGCDRNNRYKA